MSKTVLQIPVSKSLRVQAESAAYDFGFSSLQEVIRVFMTKLAKRTIDVSFQDLIELSPQAQARYLKMDQDFSKKSNSKATSSVEELKSQLAK